MAKIVILSQEQFDIVYKQLNVNPKLDKDYIFNLYQFAMNGAQQLLESNILGRIVPINSVVLILYIINEYGFYLDSHKLSNVEIAKDENASQSIISISLDKYFTNEHLNFKNKTLISRYSPQISTLSVYLNFVLGVLSRLQKNNPKQTLLVDIMSKGFSMCKAITELIVDGFETEAFSTWRTLHETECILILLTKYGEPIIKSYLRHMDYAMAFRGAISSKEQVDAIFVEIKENMRKLDLKSKDMKKYIEYGYMTAIPGVLTQEGFKYNFRDGVEKQAGLSAYSKSYEMASEIAHSSPLLIYSRSDYFYHLTILNLYESFFRMEKIFTSLYFANSSKEDIERFGAMRNVYYTYLEVIYRQEQNVFKAMSEKSANKKEA